MAPSERVKLVKLSDANVKVSDPNDDVRGRKVVDKDGADVGTVDDLLFDTDQAKVRFLQVGSGGFLGLGEKKVLVPIDAITRITDHEVHIDRTLDHVVGGPQYEPNLVVDEKYAGNVYDHYGQVPYWGGGYMYPLFPYYPDRPGAPPEEDVRN